MEQTSKQSIQEKKIRVIFLPADDSTATPPKSNGLGHGEDHAISSPSPEAFTPQRHAADTPAGSVSRSDSRSDTKSLGEAKGSSSQTLTSAGGIKASVSSAAAAVANAVPTSKPELESQLAEAKATIARLQEQAKSSSGLRQRKVEPADDSKQQLLTAERVQAPAGGVPVQVVAGLCLLSFLLAYFLF